MKNFLYHISINLLILFICISPAAGNEKKTDWPVHLRILAGPEGGQWFSLSEPLSQILSKEVLPSTYRKGGGISNIEELNAKMGEMGFTLSSFIGGSASGAPEYGDIPTQSIRIIGNIYPQVLYFLIRTDFLKQHDIANVGDLLKLHAPVRFALLKRGTASEFFVRILLKYGYKTDYASLRRQGWRFFFNNYPETADEFVAGELDCFAYTAGTHVPLLLDLQNYTKFTALPITEKVLDEMAKRFKFGTHVISPHVYKGITEPVTTLRDYTCLVVRKDLPDDLVNEILTSLWNHKENLAEKMIEFRNYSADTAVPEGIALHPGARKFWNRFQE